MRCNLGGEEREYNQSVQNVEHGVFGAWRVWSMACLEHGVFTPLVFTTTGSMGKEGTTFYKRLADMLSHKQEKLYSVVMGWLRCRLSFAILRSAIMCTRGTRSSFDHPVNKQNLTLASAEGQITAQRARTASEDEGYSDNDATQKATYKSQLYN